MATQRIRIKLKGYDFRTIDQSANDIVETAKRTGARVSGPVPLPTKIEKYSVNRSVHINKKSMEQFELRTHKRLIDIVDPTVNTVDELKKLNLPSGAISQLTCSVRFFGVREEKTPSPKTFLFLQNK